MQIKLKVNGIEHTRPVEPRKLLVDFLREDLELTGTHVGCEHGVCGACTVFLDGRSARSCLTFAVQVDGRFACADRLLEQIRHPLDIVSPDQDVDVRGTLENLGAPKLRHATTHTDPQLGALALEPAQALERVVELLSGLLADGAGVDEDEVGALGVQSRLVASLS